MAGNSLYFPEPPPSLLANPQVVLVVQRGPGILHALKKSGLVVVTQPGRPDRVESQILDLVPAKAKVGYQVCVLAAGQAGQRKLSSIDGNVSRSCPPLSSESTRARAHTHTHTHTHTRARARQQKVLILQSAVEKRRVVG